MSPAYLTDSNKMLFYQAVWETVSKIPKGKVATYGQIAALVRPPEGMEEKSYKAFGARWVGGAMAACPEGVPWQRVVNSQGKISIGGEGARNQRDLLESEGIIFDDRNRINLKKYQWNVEPANDDQLGLPW